MTSISPKLQARIGGALYLIIMILGFFSEGYVRGKLIVSGDAVATAHKILASEQLYRLGGAAEFVTLFCDVVVALILYNLLKPVSPSLALLAAVLRWVFCAVYAVLSIAHFAPLALLGGAPYLTPFTNGELQSLAYLFLKLHGVGYDVALVFFGVHCLLIGSLIAWSSFLPRLIGALLVIAGACYVVSSLTGFVAPDFAAQLFPYILLPGFIAEGSLALWLTIVGLNARKWESQAAHVEA